MAEDTFTYPESAVRARNAERTRLILQNARLKAALDEAIECIGDGDNGPPPCYADVFERLVATRAACDEGKEK